MERASAASLSAAEITTVVRRFGFILLKVHEIVMTRLTGAEDAVLAERVNDTLKPMADLLVHFTLEDDNGEV